MKKKAVFFRKEDSLVDKLSSYVVEKVVVLKQRVYDDFAANLLEDYDFLWEYNELMYVDRRNVWHCVLVKAEGAQDGILVNSEGASYARYAAYCPNCANVEGKVK